MNYFQKYKKIKREYLEEKEKDKYKVGGKQKYYYHGSSNKIEGNYLEPRPSKVIDMEKAVFATNEKLVSLVFIPKWSDCDLGFGFFGDTPYLEEKEEGAFDQLKNVSGYIYYLDPKSFKSDPRLGMQNHEFISKETVKILKKEHIKDVYKELKKTRLRMLTFDMKMEAIDQYFKNKN